MICFLALVIHRIMRMCLEQHNRAYSVESAHEKLQAIQLHQVQIGYRTYRGLTQMDADQLDLFKVLQVKKPEIGAL